MTTEADPFASIASATPLPKLRNRVLLGGFAMIALGTGAVLMPWLSSLIVEILIGWVLTMSGALTVAGAVSLRGTGLFPGQLICALTTLAAGLLLLISPVCWPRRL